MKRHAAVIATLLITGCAAQPLTDKAQTSAQPTPPLVTAPSAPMPEQSGAAVLSIATAVAVILFALIAVVAVALGIRTIRQLVGIPNSVPVPTSKE